MRWSRTSGTAEITVLEDEISRPIVDIRPANLPLKVVVIVDTSGTTAPGFDRVQEGLASFLADLPTGQEVSILTVAPEPTWVMQGGDRSGRDSRPGWRGWSRGTASRGCSMG